METDAASAVSEFLLRRCLSEETATALKAMYLFYCSTHSSSDTCIYKYRQLLFFIYCKRADWKDFPRMAKWEWGLTVRDSNVVEVTQVQEKWNRTGAQNEQKATWGVKREALAQDAQKVDRWYALTPDNNQVQDFGGINPQPVPGTDGHQFRVVNKWRSKGPLLYSCGHQQPFCVKARWQKESLGQYCAAKAEGEGLRHGKHSSVPFTAAMANEIQT